jgi:AcrR family transcriptional regulator
LCRPRDPQADEAILSTALRLLVQDGYARLTVNAVAARDREGKARLYRRWPTKERLVPEAIRRRHERERDAVEVTGYEPVAFGSAKSFGQYLIRNAIRGFVKVLVAASAVSELGQHGKGSASVEQVDGPTGFEARHRLVEDQ